MLFTCLLLVFRCYFIAQSYLSVKKYKEVLALYERVLEYAQQSLETHQCNEHDNTSKARLYCSYCSPISFVTALHRWHASSNANSSKLFQVFLCVVTAVVGFTLRYCETQSVDLDHLSFLPFCGSVK